MTWWLSLADRTALVTGSARGIGLEIARGLGLAGARVFLNGRSNDNIRRAVESLRSERIAAEALCFDVTDEAAATAALDSAPAEIDVLVNNVGQRDRRGVFEITPEDFRRLLESDLVSAYTLSRLVAIRVVERQATGRIVNVSSTMGQLGRAGDVAYSTAKAGMNGLTRTMAAELGCHGITVNAVAPGLMATETNAHALADPAWTEWVEHVTAIRRWGRAEDVAGIVAFLASDAASYITGETIGVNGGLTTTLSRPPTSATRF